MSLQLGSYAVEGSPGAPGWRGVGRDERLGRAVEATFLGTPDGGAYDWLLLLAARASVPRPQVVPLVDLVAGPQGLFAITPPVPPMPVRLTGGAADRDLLARMAETVAALHAGGIFHGALRDWWRDDGGTPVLAGTGFAWLLAGQRFGRFEEGFARDREQLEQLSGGGGVPTIAALPGAEGPRRTMLLDRGAALAGMPAAVPAPPLVPAGAPPAERTVLLDSGGGAPPPQKTVLLDSSGAPAAGAPPAERTVLMPGGGGGASPPARTELLPTGSGAPPAERTVLMPGGSSGPGGAPGGVARTELLPTAPAAPTAGPPGGRHPTTAAPVVLGSPGAAPPGAMPAIETIIEHRPATRDATAPRPARRKGRAALLLGVLALLFVLVAASLGAWWWISHRRAASAEATPAATVVPAAAATAPLQVVAVPWGLATVRTADGAAPAGAPQAPQPTPLVLQLPPGRYVVAVTNPELGGAAQRCDVEVKAGEPATCRLVLKQWSSEDYFRSVGWR